MCIFQLGPSLKSGNFKTVLRDGCLFGLLAYATYDMTNLATVTNWPVIVTIVDIIWGVVITSSSAISGYIFAKKFGGQRHQRVNPRKTQKQYVGLDTNIRLVET